MQTVAITGATGFIGQALGQHFTANGWNVVALSRKDPSSCATQWQYFDLGDHNSNLDLNSVDVLIHAAYEKGRPGIDAMKVNHAGTLRLLEAARRDHVGKALFISSFSAHEHARSVYARQKLQIESDVRDRGGVIIRPGLVLGVGGLFASLAHQLKKRPVIPLIDGGRQPLQSVHIDDLVLAIAAVIDRDLEGAVNAAEAIPLEYREFFSLMAAHLDVRCMFVPIDSRIALAAVRVAEWLQLPMPISADNVLGACDLVRRDTSNDARRLGLEFRSARKSLTDICGSLN